MIFVYYLWKTIRLPLLTHSLGPLDFTRLARFAVLLVIFIVSVTLYSIITASWVRWNDHDHLGASSLQTLLSISIAWEGTLVEVVWSVSILLIAVAAITPILYFFIFAAHEEVFST